MELTSQLVVLLIQSLDKETLIGIFPFREESLQNSQDRDQLPAS
jgi:hypothetical protein